MSPIDELDQVGDDQPSETIGPDAGDSFAGNGFYPHPKEAEQHSHDLCRRDREE